MPCSDLYRRCILFLLLTLLTAPAQGQVDDGWLKEAASPFTIEQLVEWRDTLMPHVEAVAGREFAAAPEVELVTRTALQRTLVLEAQGRARAMGRTLDASAEFTTALQAMSRLGLTQEDTGRILVPGGNLPAMLEMAGIDAANIDAIAKVILIHELAHALQFQQVEMRTQTLGCRTTAEFDALQALRKGMAMAVQQRVSARLGLASAEAKLREMMSLSGSDDERGAGQRRNWERWYLTGERFVNAHAAGESLASLWPILKTPPVLYAQVRDPETLGEEVRYELSVNRLYAGLSDMIGLPNVKPVPALVSGAKAAEVYGNVRPDLVPPVAAALKQVANGVFNDAPNGKMCAVTVFELNDASGAPVVLGAIEELVDVQDQRLRALADSGTLELEAPPRVGLDLPGAGQAWVQRYILVPEGQPEVVGRLTIAAGHRGVLVVQLSTSGLEIADDAIVLTLNTVLDRMEHGQVLLPVEPPSTDNPMAAALVAAAGELKPAGAWDAQYREGAAAGLTRLIGDDVGGRRAIETGYVASQGAKFERSAAPRTLYMFSVIEMATEETAERLATALLANLDLPLRALTRVPGVTIEYDPPLRLQLGQGRVIELASVQTTLPNQAPGRMQFGLIRQGRFIVQMSLTTTDLADLPTQAVMTTLMDAMRGRDAARRHPRAGGDPE